MHVNSTGKLGQTADVKQIEVAALFFFQMEGGGRSICAHLGLLSPTASLPPLQTQSNHQTERRRDE